MTLKVSQFVTILFQHKNEDFCLKMKPFEKFQVNLQQIVDFTTKMVDLTTKMVDSKRPISQ